MGRQPLSEHIRDRVRDRDLWTCQYCGWELGVHPSYPELQRFRTSIVVDHVVPFAYSQDNSDDNLVTACAVCNSIASDNMWGDYETKTLHIICERGERDLPIFEWPSWL